MGISQEPLIKITVKLRISFNIFKGTMSQTESPGTSWVDYTMQ